MSYNQPRPDRSETQYRRTGRSAGYHHQQRPTSGGYSKGSGAGTAPAPSISVDTSSNRSFKKTNNAQGGQPRVNFPPVNLSVSKDGLPHNNPSGSNVQSWSQVTGATGAPVMGGATNLTDSSSSTRSSRAIPKAPTSQSTAVSSKSNETGTPIKGSGDASKAFALQFGTLGPDLMKIPARTSSAPPNMDEHKRAQMQQGALRSAPNKQDLPKAVDNQSTRKEGHDSLKEKRDGQIPHIAPPSQTQKPHVAHIRMPSVQPPYQHAQISHPVHFGGPNMHMQPPNVAAPSYHQMSIPMALSMGNSPHMQPQLFFQGLPSHPMPHQSVMHRPQGLGYANSVPPQIHPQLSHMGVGLSPQFTPQQVGKSGGPRKTTPTTPVKITHPDTHEELRLDRRGDTYKDGGSVTSKSHPNTPPRPQLVSSFVPRPGNSVQTPYNFNTMIYPPASVPLHSTPVSSTQTFPASEGSQRIQFINQSALTSPQLTRPIVSGDRLPKSSAIGNARNVMSATSHPTIKVTVKPTATCEKLGSPKDLKSCVEDNNSLSQKNEEVKTATERKGEIFNESNSNKDYQEQTCKVETAQLRTDDVGQTKVSDPSLPSSCSITKTETVDSEKDSSLQPPNGIRKQNFELSPTSETRTSDAPDTNMENVSVGLNHTSLEISGSPPLEEELKCDVRNVSDKHVERSGSFEEKHDSKSVVLMNHIDLSADLNQSTSNHSSPRDGTEQNEVDGPTDVCLGSEKVADIANDLSSEIPHFALQPSNLPRDHSDGLSKHHGAGTTGDSLILASTATLKEKSAFESNTARNASTKGKKKKKEILQKADAAGTTSDLYMAYKGPEEKKETTPSSESSSVVQDTSDQNQEPAKLRAVAESTVETEQRKNEPEDWEDAADVSTPKLETLDNALDTKRGSSDDVSYSCGNTEKKYSRDFLLKFAEQCTALPEGFKALPDIADILCCANMGTSHHGRDSHPTPGKVMDRQTSASRADRRSSNMVGEDRWTKNQGSFGIGYGGNVGFQPGQAGNSGVLRNPRMQGPIMSRPMQSVGPMGGMGRNMPDADRWQRASNFQQKGLFPSPHTPMPVMHKAEKKYQVGKVTDEEQAKQRQLKGILNKLTPQNFEKLFEQVKSVNIDNAGTLTGVISQIFDKALMEPTFCEMYADFCLHLSGELPEFDEDGEKTTFRRVLLNKCQEEFERGEREEEEAARAEEGQVKQTEGEREEKRVQARRRMLGNIRLIGELYKKRMLTEKIMHGCIKKLLGYNQDPDEENIEALCKLMSTIGVMIDHPKAKAAIDNYFEKITMLSNKQELATRLRFLLRDVIDLRKNKWQQRRKVEGPKKIEELHKDAENELKFQGNRNSRPSMNTSARKGSTDFGSRGGMLASPSSQMGSYHASPKSRGYGNQDIRFDERQLYDNRMVPMPQRSLAEESITLGPQGGLGQGMSTRRPATAVSSGFPSDASAASGDPRQRPSGLTNFGAQRPASPAAYGRSSSAQERGTNYGNRDTASISRAPDLSIGAPSGTQAPVPSLTESSTPQENAFPEERLREMSLNAIKEFYSARDEKEMGLCIKDLKSPNFHPTMISLWVTDSFERKDIERDILTKLLINLVKSPDRFISESQLVKGFESVLTTIEDAVNDAPRAGEYLGRIFGKSVIEKVVPLQEIGRLIRNGGEEPGNLIEFGLGGDVLGSALEVIKSETGQDGLEQIQQSSGLCLNDFKPRPPSRSKILDKFT